MHRVGHEVLAIEVAHMGFEHPISRIGALCSVLVSSIHMAMSQLQKLFKISRHLMETRQSNMDRLAEHVDFAPAPDTVNAIVTWLRHHGLSRDRVSLSDGEACGEANELFKADFMLYEKLDTLKTHLRVKDGLYHLPATLVVHVGSVHPTMRFPLRHHSLSSVHNTPLCLYDMHGIDAELLSDLDADTTPERQAVASYISEYYVSLAWSLLGYLAGNVLPQMKRVPEDQPQGDGSEAELDTQYITAASAALHTYVMYVADDEEPFVTLCEDVLDAQVPPSVVSISYGMSGLIVAAIGLFRWNGTQLIRAHSSTRASTATRCW